MRTSPNTKAGRRCKYADVPAAEFEAAIESDKPAPLADDRRVHGGDDFDSLKKILRRWSRSGAADFVDSFSDKIALLKGQGDPPLR